MVTGDPPVFGAPCVSFHRRPLCGFTRFELPCGTGGGKGDHVEDEDGTRHAQPPTLKRECVLVKTRLPRGVCCVFALMKIDCHAVCVVS